MKCKQRALHREVFDKTPGVAKADITGGIGAAEDEEDGRREGRSDVIVSFTTRGEAGGGTKEIKAFFRAFRGKCLCGDDIMTHHF